MNHPSSRLELRGLSLAPSQVLGSVRIVPLLRAEPRGDLRLYRRDYEQDVGVVALDGRADAPRASYCSYIPHALVLAWGKHTAEASLGTRLGRARDGRRLGEGHVRILHRMAKREGDGRLRLLPLHLAMEGFLALHFGGPDVAWSEYSRDAIARGLSPRLETVFGGRWIVGLEDALRVFELHATQVGMLLFVADVFASAFAVPTPEDYRMLHRTLLRDMFGELIWQYALFGHRASETRIGIDAAKVDDLESLQAAVDHAARDWSAFEVSLADDLFARPVTETRVHGASDFVLSRFHTDMQPHAANHIGERIVDGRGDLQYLKTFRLSDGQARRAFLLQQLSLHDWNLGRTAEALGHDTDNLVRRLANAGLGYLLKEHVLRAAQRRNAG